MTILGNTIYIVSFVALAVILGTKWLNKSIKRTITWDFFIASSFKRSWLIHCTTFFLSMGHQVGDSAPSFGLCFVQAALHFTIVATVRGIGHSSTRTMAVLVWILITVPILVYLAFLLMTIIPQTRAQELHLLSPQVYTVIILWKNSQTFRAMNPHSRDRVFRSIVFRIGVFTVFPIIALFSTNSWTPSSGMRINVIDASLTLACAIIFGSQEDLLRVWMFWREASPYRSTQHSQTHSSGPDRLRSGGRSRVALDTVVPRVGIRVSTTQIQDTEYGYGWPTKAHVDSDVELHSGVVSDLKSESL
ncbi:hypothetical protein EV360DRAFT_70266 [Lentinula raphanica]|nr:hypothetical protein EV360DRAFT_70266 [Lentinula raphanica]